MHGEHMFMWLDTTRMLLSVCSSHRRHENMKQIFKYHHGSEHHAVLVFQRDTQFSPLSAMKSDLLNGFAYGRSLQTATREAISPVPHITLHQ